MKSFSFTPEELGVLLDVVSGLEFKNFRSTEPQFQYDMDYGYLSGTPAEVVVKTKLRELGYVDLVGLRVNRYSEGQYVEQHFDTAFPGFETLIISLTTDNRFYYRMDGLPEYVNQVGGLILPSHFAHGVTQGEPERLSIVGWVREPQKRLVNIIELGYREGVWMELLAEATEIARLSGRDVAFNYGDVLVLVDGVTSTNVKTELTSSECVLDLRRTIEL